MSQFQTCIIFILVHTFQTSIISNVGGPEKFGPRGTNFVEIFGPGGPLWGGGGGGTNFCVTVQTVPGALSPTVKLSLLN